MIEPGQLFTDAELANAYAAGATDELLPGESGERIRHGRGLFAVAEMAITAFIGAGYRKPHDESAAIAYIASLPRVTVRCRPGNAIDPRPIVLITQDVAPRCASYGHSFTGAVAFFRIQMEEQCPTTKS